MTLYSTATHTCEVVLLLWLLQQLRRCPNNNFMHHEISAAEKSTNLRECPTMNNNYSYKIQ